MILSAAAARSTIFADTSAFFALADRTDRFHSLAIHFLKGNTALLLTSNFVVYETITLTRMRLGHDQAVKVGQRLLNRAITPLIRVTPIDERKAWALFQQCRDKRFSFVDCTSFVLMRRLRITAAFAFDDDFRQFSEWVVYPTTITNDREQESE